MRVTIKDVAKRANVSVATVSRVLNQSKPVSEEIQKKVLEAIQEMGFNPNAVARSLVMKKSSLIGVLIPDISNMFFSMLVRGIEEECYKHQYTTLLCNTNGEIEKEIHYLNILKDKYVDGIVILTTSIKEEHVQFFNNHSIPVIFASQSEVEDGLFASININDFQAAYDATNYLIALGHQRIGILSGPLTDIDSGYARHAGYKEALKEHGLTYDSAWFREGNYDIKSGYEKGKEILNITDKPTAIFCSSDAMAIGVIRAANELGLTVPQDLSVMGFDDISIAEAFLPALTTVQQPIYEMGTEAAKILLKQIKDKDNDKQRKEGKIMPHKIIVRDSCRKLT